MCSGHHAARHDGRLMVTGRAPRELRFRWTYGEPLPPNLGAFERLVEIRRRALGADGELVSADAALDDLGSNPRWVQARHRAQRKRENMTMSRVLRRCGLRPEGEPDPWTELEAEMVEPAPT